MGDGCVGGVRRCAVKRRVETPHDRAVAARVAAARPESTPTPGYVLEALGDLDGDTGELLDEWRERASIREYLGEQSRDEAERAALEDIVQARRRP
jgi:hypothetical protein